MKSPQWEQGVGVGVVARRWRGEKREDRDARGKEVGMRQWGGARGWGGASTSGHRYPLSSPAVSRCKVLPQRHGQM